MTLKKIKEHFSDELFLAFYKKGNFKHYYYTKKEFQNILKVFKEMSLDKSNENYEKIYEKNILIIIKDIEYILKKWKFDVKSLKKGSIFYTFKNEKYSVIQKWKIKKILNYNNLYFGTKKMFEVEQLDFESMIVDKKNNIFLFNSDELFQYASLDLEVLKKIEEKNSNNFFSHFKYYFDKLDDNLNEINNNS